MADGFASGLSPADIAALIASSAPTTFVGGAAAMTVAQLMANYPPAVGYQGMYARVSDLYGSVDDIMRCRFDGVAYRWVPQRDTFNGSNAATTGTVTITPLITPPTLRLTGTLLGNMTIATNVTNAWIGMRQRVIQVGTIGLFTSTITGLLGSNLTLLGNTVKDIEYGASGWFASS